MSGSTDCNMIFAGVDGRLKAMVPPPALAASPMACRSDPAPLSLLLVTVKVPAAFAATEIKTATVARRIARIVAPGPGRDRPAAGTHAKEGALGIFLDRPPV